MGTSVGDHGPMHRILRTLRSTALLAATTLLLTAVPVHAQPHDHGMDPDVVRNPGDTPNRPDYHGPEISSWLPDGIQRLSSDPTVYEGFIQDFRPQTVNPMFPDGREHLPQAEIDMDPQILARLRAYARVDGDRIRQINAWSPSMGRTIPLIWIVPEDLSEPRPVAYFLGGGDGGQGRDNWITKSDIVDFYSQRNIHVIMPMLGAYSMYTDWLEENPDQGGKQMWETFLTHELPGPLEEALGADGKRSLVGMSMSGTTALLYATHQPGFYDSVAALSGCGDTNSWIGRRITSSIIEKGNGTPEMMWGAPNSDYSRYQDATINADRLRDQPNMYVYNATGLLSGVDFEGPNAPEAEWQLKDRLSMGLVIEAGTNLCTHRLKAATDAAGIDTIHYDFHTTGTHSWDAWWNAVLEFWPLQARGFGIATDPADPVAPEAGRFPDIWGSAARTYGSATAPALSSLIDDPVLSTRSSLTGSSAEAETE